MTDLNKFKHKTTVTVRFNEVDMLGVCNNSVYLVYFDEARFKYIKEIGLMPEGGWFSDGRLFFMVRNEINYFEHRSEEHTSELQSLRHLVCRLLLEKKKN